MPGFVRRIHYWQCALASVFLVGLAPAVPAAAERQDWKPPMQPLALTARVVAVGIPGAGAVSSVGTFLPGGPIHDLDTPAQPFARTTNPNQILDPRRIVVASSSNFGAPLAHADEAPGAILSIDPNGPDTLAVPSTFAASGGQAAEAAGRIRLFTAQSPPFRNDVNTPKALTGAETAVSNPLGISINNAFGRLWFANAPRGLTQPGTSTVIDPTGIPLFGAPSATAGGVFLGNKTNRSNGKGLSPGAVGTALLGPSPDGTTANNAAKTPRVVFAVVTADGAVEQVHVVKGVDDLAPPGTITPLVAKDRDPDRSDDGPMRVGVAWDGMCLFITDPLANRVIVLMLKADSVSPTAIFHLQSVSRIPVADDVLDTPIDIAPTQPETASKQIASNTSLSSSSDLYVANRGNNTIVRLREDGTVLGVRRVVLPGSEDRDSKWQLNGIGVSPDGSRIWATVGGTRSRDDGSAEGAVLELPAF